MHLKKDPTKEQLKNLIAAQDDEAGDHMHWVSVEGEVFLETVPESLTPAGHAESLDGRMLFRLETMRAGNDYAGPRAAEDKEWIDRVYAALVTNYEQGVRGYVDTF
jgi:hypothetical protein